MLANLTMPLERLAVEGQALYDREFSLEVFAARVVAIYRECCSFDVPRRDGPLSRHDDGAPNILSAVIMGPVPGAVE
jgi:hypothetical protein